MSNSHQKHEDGEEVHELFDEVILTTGGFAADQQGFLYDYAPEKGWCLHWFILLVIAHRYSNFLLCGKVTRSDVNHTFAAQSCFVSSFVLV